jgi:hypothetical protein
VGNHIVRIIATGTSIREKSQKAAIV